MDIAGLPPGSRPQVSLEFFPPATSKMEERLWQNIQVLSSLQPRFVSVTYGAGGSTRQRTHRTVIRLLSETSLTPAAHLTCIGSSRQEVELIAEHYRAAGIRHIVALRGDPPGGESGFRPHPRGYRYASELVEALKRIADFEISVAAYPEGHPEAQSRDADLDNLKRKVDGGAVRAITQFFFDPSVFLRFRDRVAAAGIQVELVPGILPVTNFARTYQFARQCGASVPRWLEELFAGLDGDPEQRRLVAVELACEQTRCLQAEGVSNFHFYTLNRAELVRAIVRLLNAVPPTNHSAGANHMENVKEAVG